MNIATSIMILALAGFLVPCRVARAQSPVELSAPMKTSRGQLRITVKNNANQPVTGVLIKTTFSQVGHRKLVAHRYMDSTVDARYAPIRPGEVRQVSLFGPSASNRYNYDITLEAVVYQDGSTFGEKEAADLMLARRQLLLATLREYEEVVRSAWDTSGRQAAVRNVVTLRQSNRPQTRAQQKGIALDMVNDQVAQMVLSALGSETDVCDSACSETRFSTALSGLLRWESRVQSGIKAK